MKIVEILGLIGGIILPFWNLPLIVRIRHRKSSKDVSLWWAFGAWTCFVLMLPSGILSTDLVYKVFSILNFILFSAVAFYVAKYR